MSTIQTKIPTETWVIATWEEYLQAAENPDYEKAKFYYNNGKLRIEMSPLGNDHASDHSIINHGIHLYAALKNLDLNGKDNCTYHKTDCKSAQPDLSFYIGKIANAVPYGTNAIQLDLYPPPNLVVEIAKSSLSDDKGEKRLLYEDLEVQEYWIIDVKNVKIIAFTIEKEGSYRIKTSAVLPNLDIALLEEALRRTRQTNHGKVSAWLLEQWQN
ncbi:MAG: Uma2 family endonuclease [Spirulina sp.]